MTVDAARLPLQRDTSCLTEGSAISLTTFGLSADADVLWHVLLRWPDLGRHDVCLRSGLDDKRTDTAVAELLQRGFGEPAATPLGMASVDPAIAIEHAVSIEQRELAGRLSELSDLRAHLPALAQQYAHGRQRIDQELPIEVVAGRDATRHRLLLLARSARFETLSINLDTTPQGMEVARADDLAMMRRGVTARSIIQRNVLDDETLFRDFAVLSAGGEQIRVVDRVPTRLVVQDNEIAVIPLDTDDLDRGAIFVRIRTIIDMCVFLFERMWAEATPLFGVSSVPDAPSGRAARVLELMATGRKDESIARSLGVGVRTVRRDISALMAELGEQTRAATIAAAIRRGWLST
jgi:DNA-binding CsgD family transcriptional regulator